MKQILSILALATLASPAAAQMRSAAAGPVGRGAATITEADVARRIGIIADDSMMGRDTPSRGLELTAQYIADEFERFGLKPGGENGTWFQRYPIQRAKLDLAASHVGFMYAGKHEHADFSKDARWSAGPLPKAEIGGKAVLVAGPVDAKTLDAATVKDRVVLWVADYTKPSAAAEPLGAAIMKAGPKAIILVSNRDSSAFATRVKQQERERTRLGLAQTGGAVAVPVIELHERALKGPMTVAGTTVAEARASSTGMVKALDGLTVMLDAKEAVKEATAPNTIGILEGADPTLKAEYVVFSAHMDHDGVKAPKPGTTDSIWNGADDDASGTIGVVELAEAYAQAGARPKRSLIFMTVSGEEKGLWGSRWFSEHPTVPVKDIVANINIDMIGRNWKDTIVVIGKEHSDLGATLNRVNAEHPELGMTAIDDIWPNERFYFRSDHYNFARKGVPILFFFNGTHDDYHQPTDTPDKIDAEKEARILKLIYFLGQDIGNAAGRPEWKAESYKEIVEGEGGR